MNKFLNNFKMKRGPKTRPAKRGQVGYDNIRDDINRVHKMKQGEVADAPVNPLDIANKAYVDGLTSGASVSPGGVDTEIQFNDNGAFSGSSALTWDGSALLIGGNCNPLTDNVGNCGSDGKRWRNIYGNDYYITDKICKIGEDTCLDFNIGGFLLKSAGNSNLTFSATLNRFNPSALDMDTTIRGDADINLLHCDAGTDRVGIGTGTPGVKLDVAGEVWGQTFSGANVTSGTDPGHFHSIYANEANYQQTSGGLTLLSGAFALHEDQFQDVSGAFVIHEEDYQETSGAVIHLSGAFYSPIVNDPGHTHTGGGSATKEFFVQIARGHTGQAYSSTRNDFAADNLVNTDTAWFNFHIPHDFNSLTECVVICIPDATETIQWDMNADYGAAGELHYNHSETETNQTKAVTINKLEELDVSSILDNISAGDYVGMEFTSNTTQIPVIGLRFKYT